MKSLRLATAFSRDLKRIERRNYDRAGESLPRARRDHPLKGEWKGWRECHVQPDWLLIYKATDAELMLARTGTHADLFGK
jgi:mRNA interferase YafQ